MGQREAKIEQHLNTEIKKLGGITRKWVSPGRTGVPDRIVIIKGKICFVEIKTEAGKLSMRQEREIEDIRKAGGIVYVLFGQQGVDDFVQDLRGALLERKK